MAPHATLDLARELIARRSQTPDDAGCQELLKARLAPIGFFAMREVRLEGNGAKEIAVNRAVDQCV